MNALKIIGIVLLLVIAIPLVVALFIPRAYSVKVAETINQPHHLVYDYMRMLNNQTEYSVWVLADPNLNPEIIGADGTVGAIQRWNSEIKSVGEGEQEIILMTPERIEVELRFIRPFKGNANAANVFKKVNDNQTLVTSEFHSTNKYPFNLLSYLFGRKMIKEAQLQNLINIKNILENQ